MTDYEYISKNDIRWGQGVVQASEVIKNGWISKSEGKTALYAELPSVNESAEVVTELSNGEGVSVLGHLDNWYYVQYGNQYGYIMHQNLRINPSLYEIGFRYTYDLEGFRLFGEKCDPDGTENIKMNEAIEIARSAFEENKLIGLLTDKPHQRGTYCCSGMIDTGYQRAWEIIVEQEGNRFKFKIWIDADDGTIITIDQDYTDTGWG